MTLAQKRGNLVCCLILFSVCGETKIFASDFNDIFLTAQAVGFFVDGFETSSRALAFVLHELAMNPDIQDKLREELKNKFPDDNIDYDKIRSCVYLDQVLNGKFL